MEILARRRNPGQQVNDCFAPILLQKSTIEQPEKSRQS
jgi:hypothetical protein